LIPYLPGQIIGGMRPSESVQKNRAAIVEIVKRHNAKNPRLFGSCIRNEDSVSSDIDILIDPTETTTLFDIGAIRHELLELLGTPVDVVTPRALPESFRAAVIAEAKPL
jgi:predicted nucleotidyltransferase